MLRRVLYYAAKVVGNDLPRILRYGRHAPLWCQRLWVQPSQVKRTMWGFGEEASARVVAGEWQFDLRPVADLPKVRACYLHWLCGVSWQETGVYDHLLSQLDASDWVGVDGCRSLEDIVNRYERLDQLFTAVEREGQLRTRRELAGWRAFRERGGIRIHIGPGNEPVFSGAGQHRLAMAQILGITTIPAQIGLVHVNSLRTWKRAFSR